ncbi:MAG: sialidase family protein [Bacteroidia bacterium]
MNIYNLSFLLLFQFLFPSEEQLALTPSSDLPKCQLEQNSANAKTANLVFTSTDGGQSWQDISAGLPEPVKDDYGVDKIFSFADDHGLYVSVGDGIYHNKPHSTAPIWKKDIFPDNHCNIAPGRAGIFAYNYWSNGVFQKKYGTNAWAPVFADFQEKQVYSVFETATGTIFINAEKSLFRSTNSGKSWKHVGDMVGELVESNGVLLGTTSKGIVRSTDNGETWALVISEGGAGIEVERIEGGFAAITFNGKSRTRRVRTSYDGGITWQPIDADLPPQLSIASIIQVGENFFCGHPKGIFRSSDKGKTWKLLLPSIEDKVFNLQVSGNVIYAIPINGGC